MKIKSILLTAAATLSLATATMAQVPNYLPTNGLVGWWPFNGNANDESGNGNNGAVNGASLTIDRFGNTNAAFDFDGIDDYINVLFTNQLHGQTGTINTWIKTSNTFSSQKLIFGQSNGRPQLIAASQGINGNQNSNSAGIHWKSTNGQYPNAQSISSVDNGFWLMITAFYTTDTFKIYINSILETSIPTSLIQDNCSQFDFQIGGFNTTLGCGNSVGYSQMFNGKIDDIGVWNRALNQQEITALYNAVNCANNTTITPPTNTLNTGTIATFTASTSDLNPSYVWQSDFGQGFQPLNNFGNYSGVNTATLNIANVQLPNHTQPIRVISTSGNCIDTSNVAVINILDTCITNVTVYDTLLTTVTDTLVINTQITGINPPNNLNTLKVYPNPASTHITIDFGNFNAMSGYTLTIVNSIGQTVFTTPINQQTSYIDLSTWTGNGIYFVQLIDPQNNTIENRKIVIQ